ncbi:hypothetical protein HZH68_000921 [Vespula germanica]|uniref:Uncharacterized protein n=2 Tax=Vespula TaxID=7451 RepID=A0A834NUG6_VESGE|nr:hypothetical protein HZH68_000921 [Vespula germanica]KAF7438606.1 hypothetical protein H0235_000997 [Vespula pensylvanica]
MANMTTERQEMLGYGRANQMEVVSLFCYKCTGAPSEAETEDDELSDKPRLEFLRGRPQTAATLPYQRGESPGLLIAGCQGHASDTDLQSSRVWLVEVRIRFNRICYFFEEQELPIGNYL